MFENMSEAQAREQIKEMTAAYCEKYHNQSHEFEPGDRISYSARVYD